MNISKVSVITPSLNSEKFIENNLKSVHLWQKGDFSIEQIIIDGGSTDRTIEIIKSFKERYNADITIIQGQDKNMYDAINKGLKITKGNIWACLNTDDQYNPGIIFLVVEEFNKHPEIDVVYGYLDMVDENMNFLQTLYLPKFDLKLLILTRGCWCINQPATFLRKTVIDKVGYFDIKYKYASDYDYLIRVGVKCKTKLISKSFTKFVVHSNSISSCEKTKIIQIKESEEISNKYKDKFNIVNKNLFLDYLRFYLIQFKLKNIKYICIRIINKMFKTCEKNLMISTK